MSHDPEDVRRRQAFQKWVRDERERLGFSSQDCANNYNATLSPGEEEMSEAYIRTLEGRTKMLSTINRQTCRKVARALLLPINEVQLAAGYLPDDACPPTEGLPLEWRIKFGWLREAGRQQVYQAIQTAWETQVEQNTQTGDLPEDVRRRYIQLSDEAKDRLHRFIEFEATASAKKA